MSCVPTFRAYDEECTLGAEDLRKTTGKVALLRDTAPLPTVAPAAGRDSWHPVDRDERIRTALINARGVRAWLRADDGSSFVAARLHATWLRNESVLMAYFDSAALARVGVGPHTGWFGLHAGVYAFRTERVAAADDHLVLRWPERWLVSSRRRAPRHVPPVGDCVGVELLLADQALVTLPVANLSTDGLALLAPTTLAFEVGGVARVRLLYREHIDVKADIICRHSSQPSDARLLYGCSFVALGFTQRRAIERLIAEWRSTDWTGWQGLPPMPTLSPSIARVAVVEEEEPLEDPLGLTTGAPLF